jgi:hypothetical protein
MNTSSLATSVLVVLCISTALGQTPTKAGTPGSGNGEIVVNCDSGQSLNRTLAQLDKHTAIAVTVQGTCAEYVFIKGFEGLTLKGLSGATLTQPSTPPPSGVLAALLRIEASRSVLVTGLRFQATPSGVPPIGIGENSIDVHLRGLNIEGGGWGILVVDHSQVFVQNVKVHNVGFASIGVYGGSMGEIQGCVLEDTTNTFWHVGISLENSSLGIAGTTIRNMQVGIDATAGSIALRDNASLEYPKNGSTGVLIESPSGSNFNGVVLDSNSTLLIGNAKLLISNAGQPWGDDTGGVLVTGGSALVGNANLLISGSRGQGVFVTNNSHARFDGSQITGGQHGGLVAMNLSTIAVVTNTSPTEVSGNATDLFCDSQSIIAGAASISNAKTIKCVSLLPGDNSGTP